MRGETSSVERRVDEPLRYDAFIDGRFGRKPVAAWGNHAWPEGRSAPGPDKVAGMSAGPLLLSVTGIVKAFRRRPVLEDASLGVRAGEAVALLGENGAGKTTLLSICAGLVPMDAGQVRVAGRIGYCPQEPGPRARCLAHSVESEAPRRNEALRQRGQLPRDVQEFGFRPVWTDELDADGECILRRAERHD